MNSEISEIYKSILEISWRFGNSSLTGECCGDLSLVEFMALKVILDRNEITIQDIGTAMNFTKSGASKVIDRLEGKGYVVRKNSPVDGRVCCVSTTEKGTTIIFSIIANYTAYLENALKELDPQSIRNIKNALETLTGAIKINPLNSVLESRWE